MSDIILNSHGVITYTADITETVVCLGQDSPTEPIPLEAVSELSFPSPRTGYHSKLESQCCKENKWIHFTRFSL